MIQFLLCVLKYLIIMGILAVVAFCGGKVGVILRKKKDAKEEIKSTAEIDK